jgi:hypothetical protein
MCMTTRYKAPGPQSKCKTTRYKAQGIRNRNQREQMMSMHSIMMCGMVWKMISWLDVLIYLCVLMGKSNCIFHSTRLHMI